jgi:hypothetical protein
MKTMVANGWRCWLPLAALLIALTTGAQTAEPWTALQQECAGKAGAGYVQRLRQHGFTVEQARQTLACLSEAQSQQVPTSALTTRLDEGLAKKADPQAITTALQARLRIMTQARTMLHAASYDAVPDEPRNELLTATGFALESGVAAEDIGAVLKRGNGQSALRVKSIVEAGESLHLAGVDRATTQSLMSDCLDRNLRRMEVLRAVRYSVQQHRGGMSGENIRRSLWGGNTATEGARGWRGGGQGGSGACETGGAGSGAGAGNGWRGGAGSGGGAGGPATGASGSGGGNAAGGAGGGDHQHMGGTK